MTYYRVVNTDIGSGEAITFPEDRKDDAYDLCEIWNERYTSEYEVREVEKANLIELFRSAAVARLE